MILIDSSHSLNNMVKFPPPCAGPNNRRSCRVSRLAFLSLFFLALLFLSGCATLPTDYPRTISNALYLPQKTNLGKTIQPYVDKHHGDSGFYFMSSDVNAFLARVLLVEAAEQTLDLQYYSFQPDRTGKDMLEHLLKAAQRGVRVRLLLDDWRDRAEMDRWLTMMEIYPNIEVRVFNPFLGPRVFFLTRPIEAIFGPKRLRARLHNKSFIADNSVAIVGGRNIADDYFGASSNFNMRDLDVMALGPIVPKVSAVFDDYWNCVLAIPLKLLVPYQPSRQGLEKLRATLTAERAALKNSPYGVKMQKSNFLKLAETGELPLVWAKGEVLADNPLKVINWDHSHLDRMGRQIRKFLESAQSELLIITPYLVPGQAGMRWLKELRQRGVTVKIITNSLASTDEVVAQFGYMHYRKALLRMGVQLYELRPNPGAWRAEDEPPEEEHTLHFGSSSSSQGALHAKLFALDDRSVFVGSLNFDLRSFYYDTQDGIIVYSPQFAQEAADLFAKDASPRRSYRVMLTDNGKLVWITEKHGQEVRYYKEPGRKFWHDLKERIFYLLLPKSML
jgi:cardiolipin synthase C